MNMNMRHLIAIATLIARLGNPFRQKIMRAESSRLFESCGLREATAVGTMALGQGPYI